MTVLKFTRRVQPILRYATARRKYTCAVCRQPIARGATYARRERQPVRYHRMCAPQPPQYRDRAGTQN